MGKNSQSEWIQALGVAIQPSHEHLLAAIMTAVFVALPIKSYEDALAFLHGRINFERQLAVPYWESYFKLDRMRTLLARLGQPDLEQRIIHIAGTKGKGSTAAMIAAILTAAGNRTGLYTSPHLDHVE